MALVGYQPIRTLFAVSMDLVQQIIIYYINTLGGDLFVPIIIRLPNS